VNSECATCGQIRDCRPYGERGALICFRCMKATPEAQAIAERQLGAQLAACGPVAVIDGTGGGPRPFDKRGTH
jgi:hypothetical protein